MKLDVDRKHLADAFAVVGKHVRGKNTLVRIDTALDQIKLTVANDTQTVHAQIGAHVVDEGTLVLRAVEVRKAIRQAKHDDRIVVTAEGPTSARVANRPLATEPDQQVPLRWPDNQPTGTATLTDAQMRKIASTAAASAVAPASRPLLSQLHFVGHNRVVATDSYRAFTAIIDGLDVLGQFAVDAETFIAAGTWRHPDGGNATTVTVSGDRMLRLDGVHITGPKSARRHTTITVVADANFDPFTQVMPLVDQVRDRTSNDVRVKVHTSALADAVGRIVNNGKQLTPSGKMLHVAVRADPAQPDRIDIAVWEAGVATTWTDPDRGKPPLDTDTVPVNCVEGPGPLTAGFNPHFLIDAANHAAWADPTVDLFITDGLKPIFVNGATNTTAEAIQMPVRL